MKGFLLAMELVAGGIVIVVLGRILFALMVMGGLIPALLMRRIEPRLDRFMPRRVANFVRRLAGIPPRGSSKQ